MHVFWCWTAADTTCGVIGRTVAWAEPATERTRFTERYTTKVGTNADHDDPVFLTFTSRTRDIGRLRISRKVRIAGRDIFQITKSSRLGIFDFFGRTVTDENWLPAPFNGE
ncbi:hypothetical protein FQZ97_951100 [compost metagenome]